MAGPSPFSPPPIAAAPFEYSLRRSHLLRTWFTFLPAGREGCLGNEGSMVVANRATIGGLRAAPGAAPRHFLLVALALAVLSSASAAGAGAESRRARRATRGLAAGDRTAAAEEDSDSDDAEAVIRAAEAAENEADNGGSIAKALTAEPARKPLPPARAPLVDHHSSSSGGGVARAHAAPVTGAQRTPTSVRVTSPAARLFDGGEGAASLAQATAAAAARDRSTGHSSGPIRAVAAAFGHGQDSGEEDDDDDDDDDDSDEDEDEEDASRTTYSPLKPGTAYAKAGRVVATRQLLKENQERRSRVQDLMSDLRDTDSFHDRVGQQVDKVADETKGKALPEALGKMWKEMRRYGTPFMLDHLQEKDRWLQKREPQLRQELDEAQAKLRGHFTKVVVEAVPPNAAGGAEGNLGGQEQEPGWPRSSAPLRGSSAALLFSGLALLLALP